MMITPQAAVKACCHFEKEFTYGDFQEKMQPYREAMQRGEKIAPCRRCWQDEHDGYRSLRQSACEDFIYHGNKQGLMILDLRLSNNCNLACTMCGNHASSLWAKLKGQRDIRMISPEIRQAIINDSTDLIRLSVQGGEPFYGQDFISFIDSIKNKSNVTLEIFTNTITADPVIVKRWSNEFKHVMIISSVDGESETFESIRWPGKWNKFERKLLLLDAIPNIGLSFHFTVQNLNILNIADFIAWRDSKVPNREITFNVLESPNFLHFSVLTQEERTQALRELSNINCTFESETLALAAIETNLEKSCTDIAKLREKDRYLDHVNKLRQQHDTKD